MMNLTDPKSLVYGELYFITTAAKKRDANHCVDLIFDEVSREIYELFIGAPIIASASVMEPAVSILGNTDVVSIN